MQVAMQPNDACNKIEKLIIDSKLDEDPATRAIVDSYLGKHQNINKLTNEKRIARKSKSTVLYSYQTLIEHMI